LHYAIYGSNICIVFKKANQRRTKMPKFLIISSEKLIYQTIIDLPANKCTTEDIEEAFYCIDHNEKTLVVIDSKGWHIEDIEDIKETENA